MHYNIFYFAKKLDDKRNVHIFVLLSLLLQIILILFAPFRKRTRRWIVILLPYFLADGAANFAFGLISKSKKDATRKGFQQPDEHADILAFWAPFLLLHLGSPDTITAFALVDNTLWLRHLVGFITHVLAAIIVFYLSFPRNSYGFLLSSCFLLEPSSVVSEQGLLYLANPDKFRKSLLKEPDPGPHYANLMAEYSSKKKAKLPTQIELIAAPKRESKIARSVVEGNLTDLQVVKYAYDFFNTFRGLIVDLIFSFHECDESKHFFYRRTPEDAFNVLATELNFMYEVLYTKVQLVHSVFGYIVQFISWCAVVAALSKFYSLDKSDFRKIDVGTTCSLFFGAICLDTIAFSDWTANSIQNSKVPIKNCFQLLLINVLSLRKIKWPPESPGHWGWATPIFFRRWSGKMLTYNLISYCIKDQKQNSTHRVSNFVIRHLGLKDFYDRITYTKDEPLMKSQWDFIFGELKLKSNLAEDPKTAKRICSARGYFAIKDSILDANIQKTLIHYVVDVDYDQSLIIWHIAIELCYHTTKDSKEKSYTKLCKILSDYILYLLIMQHAMISAVTSISEIIFYDTSAKAKRFLSGRDSEEEAACQEILNTDVEHVNLRGEGSKSVLFDACILAKKLKELK